MYLFKNSVMPTYFSVVHRISFKSVSKHFFEKFLCVECVAFVTDVLEGRFWEGAGRTG